VPEGLAGLTVLHELLASLVEVPAEVVVGTETDRGLFMGALVAAGYQVYAVNPLAVSRYRDRHRVSGAKSDAGDAKVLADLVRTDRHNHRPVAGDSELVEAVKVLARTHQSLVWTRQRQVNQLRSLSRAKLAATLARAGRQRGLEGRAAKLQVVLRAPQLEPVPVVAEAYGAAVKALVEVIGTLNRQLEQVASQLQRHFELHPDAEIVRSLPGLGLVLGARVVGEFGDDPTRYENPKARKSYAGTAPITRASGKRQVVVARLARNRRLADACYQWAFSALQVSPGHVPSTTAAGRLARPTPRPSAPLPTGWSASCTAACVTAAATTNPRPGRPPSRTPLDPIAPYRAGSRPASFAGRSSSGAPGSRRRRRRRPGTPPRSCR
jgi:transposase